MTNDIEMQCPFCFRAHIQIPGDVWDNGGICQCKNCSNKLKVKPHKVATTMEPEEKKTKKRVKK